MIGDVLAGRYRIVSQLGTGGHSTVYLAHDATLDREVAIKVLHREISDDPGQLERFRREARQVAKIAHPNVVQVIDAGEDEDGHPFIVFQYVRGATLKERIRELGRLPVPEAVAYAVEIGLGLGAAHSGGVVHRDVKPQNVLLDEEGRAKITDFGIARSLTDAGLTATGRVLGTTDYVSPEQALGHDVDQRSDIYSLGVVLWEMLTGSVPFTGETPVAVAMRHVREEIPDIQTRRPEVSAALASVLDRATAKHPEDRHPDTRALVGDLEASLEVEAARSGSVTGEATAVLDAVQDRRRAGRRRRRLPVATVSLLAVALVAAGLVLSLGGRDPAPDPPAAPQANGTAPEAVPLEASNLSDFDPEGDGREHPDEVGLAVDGDPTGTAWTTENYVERDMSGKSGVGLVIDAGDAVNARALRVRSEREDWDFEIRVADGDSAPETIEGWDTLVSVEGAGRQEDVEIPPTGRPRRHYLLWITRLAPSPTGRGFRVGITNLELFA